MREGREPTEKASEVRLFPGELEMRNEPGHEHEIEGTTAKGLICDVHFTALRVLRRRHAPQCAALKRRPVGAAERR